jgi:hypothetical protein
MKMRAQTKEDIMLGVRQICKMVALSFAGVLIIFGAPDASAQKKLTYEQAYRQCKAHRPSIRRPPGHRRKSMKQLGSISKSGKF